METAHLPDGTALQGGKYKIVRFIGSGGFGCTYEGEHTMLQRRVAIKEFFVKDFCNRDETTSHVSVGITEKKGLVKKLGKKFVEEARFTAGMNHPNIARVSDVFEENGTAYYVMDYINGLSLDKLVKECGPLQEQTALKYIRQVADALAYVHSLNRLHLDVKPGNIIADEHDNAILIDFGASKQYDEVDGENTSTLMGKTPGYAPIEQMGNTVVTFTPATDIYALGATLYKLLTGNTPIEATRLASGEELPPLPSNISTTTANAVSSAMQLAKSKRPQTIAEFIALLGSKDEEGIESNIRSTPTEVNQSELEQKDGTISEDTPSSVPPTPATDTNTGEGETILNNNNIKAEHPLWNEPTNKHDSSSESKRLKKQGIKKNSILLAIVIGGPILIFGIIALIDTSYPSIRRYWISGQCNGHDFVDLGLSVKWATCNVGAYIPSDYGNYYAWGETKTKSEYTISNSVTYDKDMSDIAGDARYDAANANWKGGWRMPTKEEMKELIDRCTWKKRKLYGTKGFLVTGPNGKSIFLPANWSDKKNKEGNYWCSTPNKNSSYSSPAYNLFFSKEPLSSKWIKCTYSSRYYAYSVRPVLDLTVNGYVNGHGYVDLGLSVKWASCNIGASSPSDYGDYYAWGESRTKSEYTKENSETHEKSMKNIAENSSYDIAYVNWGDKWRMPSYDEMCELINKCERFWITQNGHSGLKIVGPNGNSIFLPASGWRGTVLNQLGESGNYWSSTTNGSTFVTRALYFYKDSTKAFWSSRYWGYSVRPVIGKASSTSTTSQTSTQTSTSSSTVNKTSSTASSSGSTTTQQGSKQTSTQKTTSSTKSNSSKSISSASGYINGYGYVDLGLSVKWATCNVGATSPSDYGNYYAWGETKTKSDYTLSNSVMYDKQMENISGIIQYDAARAILGGTWRTPTTNEIEELINKCQWKWISLNGTMGYKVTGHNGKSIFLPAAGWRDGTSISLRNTHGDYWSATNGATHGSTAIAINFFEQRFYVQSELSYIGRSIRPVSN